MGMNISDIGVEISLVSGRLEVGRTNQETWSSFLDCDQSIKYLGCSVVRLARNVVVSKAGRFVVPTDALKETAIRAAEIEPPLTPRQMFEYAAGIQFGLDENNMLNNLD